MCQFFKNLLNLICNGDDQFTNNHQVSNYIESCRKQESNNLIQILIDNLDGINELFRATNSSPTNSILTTYGVEKKMLGSDKSLILEFVDCMLKLNNSKLTSAVAVSGIIQSSIVNNFYLKKSITLRITQIAIFIIKHFLKNSVGS